jgi:hypothetical protein
MSTVDQARSDPVDSSMAIATSQHAPEHHQPGPGIERVDPGGLGDVPPRPRRGRAI